MLGKRAQVEDYFADFLLGAIVIVVALFIGTALSAMHTSEVEARVNLVAVQFNGMDVFSLMRMPVDSYGDFAHLAVSIAEAYEAKDSEFFEFGGIARLGSEYAGCGENFEKAVNNFFGGKKWIVSIFEVQDPGAYPQKKIFECSRLGVEGLKDVRFSEAYLPSSGFTAYRILVGWKNE